jgi:5-enolpyruvylshikimate-3-phosphate synthase
MGKPHIEAYKRFQKRFYEITKGMGKEQYLVPYLMSSHPGSTLNEAIDLALFLRDNHFRPEQVQDFYPTPGTISTAMFYTELDPYTMEKVYVPKTPKEKAMQRALLQYFRPQNRELVLEALKKAGRRDLIGLSAEKRKFRYNSERDVATGAGIGSVAPTDNLPFFSVIAAVAEGRTLIHDWVFENRAIYSTELTNLNAKVELLDAHRIFITGPTNWRPAEMMAPPALRPAVVIMLAMLAAPGESILRNIYSIARGYEDFANRLKALGADIKPLSDI